MRHGCATALFIGLMAGAGCIDTQFHCSSTSECQITGSSALSSAVVAGRCEPTGYCSFPDGSGCQSGFRYGEFASAELKNRCTGTGGDGTDGGVDGFVGTPGDLITGGTFESGCDQFVAGPGSEVHAISAPHGGAFACEICGAGFARATLPGLKQPQVNRRYRLDVWLRANNVGDFAGTMANVHVEELCDESDLNASGTVGTNWTRLSKVQEETCLEPSVMDLSLNAMGSGAATVCISVDDISITPLP